VAKPAENKHDVVFQIDGLDLMLARLDKLGERGADIRPALDAVGETLLRDEAAQWGQGWEPDAQATLDSKDTPEVGVRSGKLKRSLTKRGAQWNIFEVERTGLKIGSSAPHAHLFDKGRKATRSGAEQPARPLFHLGASDKRAIGVLIRKWIAKR
jgi:phage gpG-like protein